MRANWLAAAGIILLTACTGAGPVGNPSVPQPKRSVNIAAYSGLWYELARYENGFERGCDAVTARYTLNANGEVAVVNICRDGVTIRTIEGSARVVPDSGNAKLKVSFFGPFYVGNYWILDRAPDYSWAIVGEPSGRYLWLLARTNSKAVFATMTRRAEKLGYDLSLLRVTKH